MATKIQQILDTTPKESVLFGSWLSSQGLDARGQYAYMKSGWLDRISKGVYKIHGTEPSLLAAVSSYNTQLDKSCVVGAYTALELRGYSHYLSMGKPVAYLFDVKSLMTEAHKKFLISFESGQPEWDGYEFEYFKEYPSVQWKRLNLNKLAKQNPQKLQEEVDELRKTFK